MNLAGLQTLACYNNYANRLVLDVAVTIPQDLLVSSSSPSRDSIYRLLTHMLACEKTFLDICRGVPPAELSQLPDVVQISTFWQITGQEYQDYLTHCQETDLLEERNLPFQLKGAQYHLKVWELLTQAIIHSIHHRGELSIVMTNLGFPLPTLDIILWMIDPPPRPIHLIINE